jgi:hypothetical protein
VRGDDAGALLRVVAESGERGRCALIAEDLFPYRPLDEKRDPDGDGRTYGDTDPGHEPAAEQPCDGLSGDGQQINERCTLEVVEVDRCRRIFAETHQRARRPHREHLADSPRGHNAEWVREALSPPHFHPIPGQQEIFEARG